VDGGGYLGLATASFIKGIEHHLGIRFSDSFDLFCGTSTGAILALGLAVGRSGAELTDLYRRLGKSIFANPRLTRGYGMKARYDNRPLRQSLKAEFGQATLGDLCSNEKFAMVTAFNLTDGEPRIFKTDHASHLTLHNKYLLSDIALASSAAPFYFPAVPVRNPINGVTELYCDGGVVANHPALLGFSEAVSDLKVPPGEIRILSLSTPGEDFAEGTTTLTNGDRGLAKWRAKLPSMFIESGAAIADQILRRLINALPEESRPRYERVEMRNRDGLAMDCATPAATRALDHEGATQASYNSVRDQVKRIIG
jgi:patatin-like phospholipase/acyl hydrolase